MVFKSKLKIVENKRCANRPTKTPQTKNYAISLLFKNSPRKRFFFRARFNNAGAENCQTLLQTGLKLYFYDFFLSPAFRISLSAMNLWLFVVLANFPWGAHISSIVIDTAHAKIASIVPYNRSWEIFISFDAAAAAAAAIHLNLTLCRNGKFSHRLFVHANKLIACFYGRVRVCIEFIFYHCRLLWTRKNKQKSSKICKIPISMQTISI